MRSGFAGLLLALALAPTFVSAQVSCASFTPLSFGSSGPAVTALQRFLFEEYSNFPPSNGVFDATTEGAVKQWQTDHGIVSSGDAATTGWGVVGRKTAAAMKFCTASSATPPTTGTTGTPTTSPSPSNNSSGPRTLSRGMTGTDVTTLQTFLISQGLLQGPATGFFGPLTEIAVQSWQSRNGIVSSGAPDTTGYGAVGPRTRALIIGVAAGSTTYPSYPSTPAPPPVFNPPVVTVPTPPVTTGVPNTQTNVGSRCPVFSRYLSRGASGTDVQGLQAFLVGQGLLSDDSMSGYFGTATEAALQRWQAQQGVVSSGGPATTGWGALGDMTRVAISQRCANLPPVVAISECTGVVPTCPSGTRAGGRCNQECIPVNEAPTCTVVSDKSSVNPGEAVVLTWASRNTSSGTANTSRALVGPSGSTIVYPIAPTTYSYTFYGNNGTQVVCSATVQINAQRSCTVGSVDIPHEGTRTFYSRELVGFGESCATYSQSRTCTNGSITGTSEFNKVACNPATTSSCVQDGATVLDNGTKKFYTAQTVAFGTTNGCESIAQTRKCVKGILDGNASYVYQSCTIAPAGSCTLDGKTVNHAAQWTFYTASVAPVGQACTAIQKSRTCSNGAFPTADDAYNKATCAPASCVLDGVTVISGASREFFTASSVPFGSTCTKTTRLCTNGRFPAATDAYNKANCTVASQSGPTCTLAANPSTLRPNQTTTLSWTTQNSTGGTLFGTAISPVASGSRVFGGYSTVGERSVTLSVTGGGGSGQCSTTLKVQDVLPPTCTLTAKKNAVTTVLQSPVTVLYSDTLVLNWTSAGATDYASSTPSTGASATTSVGVASGSYSFKPTASSYTYTFNNAGGSAQCTMAVNYSPPTCTLATVPSTKTTYIYGDPVTLTWSSTNADYATATSSDRNVPSGTVTLQNVTDSTTYSFTFYGRGGQTTCTKAITVNKPLTVSQPTGGIYQKGNDLTIAWQYPGAASTVGVYLMLVDLNGQQIGGSFVGSSGLNPTSAYVWNIPETLGSALLTGGQYKIRAVAYTPKTPCTAAGCGTTLVRADSGAFTISVPTAAVSSCTLDGKTVEHGASGIFYSASSVAFDKQCSSVSLSRTCANGTFLGSTTFDKASCTPAPMSVVKSSAGLSSLIVPAGFTTLTVKAWGAGGGGGVGDGATNDYGGAGGPGGFVQSTIAVTPGETLTIEVGTGGAKGVATTDGGNGGGYSAVKRGTTFLLQAGGGGGGGGAAGNGGATPTGSGGIGGAGGGSTGATDPFGGGYGGASGLGGTQTAGGAGGTGRSTGADGAAGILNAGGNGGTTGAGGAGGTGGGGKGSAAAAGGGGGGGGGHYGGGGGENAVASELSGGGGGGGGSSLVTGTNISDITSNNGMVPNTSDSDYNGTGGAPGDAGNTLAQAVSGKPGLVVIAGTQSVVASAGVSDQYANLASVLIAIESVLMSLLEKFSQ